MSPIDLGLGRIAKLVQPSSWTWKAIHVAGTNGKGSITAYVSAILYQASLRVGRFNSPHLLDQWDSVSINEAPVEYSIFAQAETRVRQRNEHLKLQASDFEILTATAFECFNLARIQVGVVEVGLGGRLDATNVLQPQIVLVSVISKVGLDHQALLGNTIEEIAREKAGIIKSGVPCVVDGSNQPSVLETILRCAEQVKAPVSIVTPASSAESLQIMEPFIKDMALVPHQLDNLLLAFRALQVVQPSLPLHNPIEQSLEVLPKVVWPGRLQKISLQPVLDQEALLDGAHNPQAARVLAEYVNLRLRPKAGSIQWIVAFSQGKDIASMLETLCQPGDTVIATTFGPVEGMSWVVPAPPSDIIQSVDDLGDNIQTYQTSTAEEAITLAGRKNKNDKSEIVIAGSLYLVSDVLRLLRSRRGQDTSSNA